MIFKRLISTSLALLLLLSALPLESFAAGNDKISQATDRVVRYTHGKFAQKGASAIDDWSVIGLSLSGQIIGRDQWGSDAAWDTELRRRMRQLDPRKTTDYARFVLTLLAAGKNPVNYEGVNLLDRLKNAQLANGKFADSLNGQGQSLINAHVWSIIAFYASGEQIPRAKLAKSWLLSKQLPDGGFQFETGSKQSGIDMTAMTLLALRALEMAKTEQPVQKALQFLRKAQVSGGGFLEGGLANSESAANVTSALLAWGEQPQTWRKDPSGSVLDALLSYQKGDGSFSHTRAGMSNQMATAQALLALSDVKRGRSYLFYLRERSGDNKLLRLHDLLATHWAFSEIGWMVRNGYLQGVTETEMRPDSSVTRAQFAALLLRAVGEVPNQRGQGIFHDVPASDWSAPIVEKAAALGLMQGSQGKFRPHDGISHEEMAVIAARTAKRYGWNKTYSGATAQVNLHSVSSWAQASVKELQNKHLIGNRFSARAKATRADSAVLLYRLLATR